jgi:uncharacterized protein YkwD
VKQVWGLALWLLAGPAVADDTATGMINDIRAQAGQPALGYSTVLEAAARAHAQDMARKGFFDHRGSDGSDIGARVRRQGYGWCFVAENIAKGQWSLTEVMNDWIASPGHRRNLLDTRAREFALVEAGERIWVMVLAAPGC